VGSSELNSPPLGLQGGTPGRDLGAGYCYVPNLGGRTTSCRLHRQTGGGEGSAKSARRANQVAPGELSMVPPSEQHRVVIVSALGRKTKAYSGDTLVRYLFLCFLSLSGVL
jgi:hypothetical protein